MLATHHELPYRQRIPQVEQREAEPYKWQRIRCSWPSVRDHTGVDGVGGHTRWNVTIDQTEQTALTDILDDCPNTPVEVTLTR
ncbi:hypothetical protein ACFZCU_45110 [Streptomyces canus]|uniref:hypothetical protein n=1 Tax=Streptomyces canus TaxID=58343 RepID=UPI0036EDC39E